MYMSQCVRACVRACVRPSVCVCVKRIEIRRLSAALPRHRRVISRACTHARAPQTPPEPQARTRPGVFIFASCGAAATVAAAATTTHAPYTRPEKFPHAWMAGPINICTHPAQNRPCCGNFNSITSGGAGVRVDCGNCNWQRSRTLSFAASPGRCILCGLCRV